MTLVAFDIERSRASMVTDSLAYSNHMYRRIEPGVSKMRVMPAMNAVVAGTGAVALIESWTLWVDENQRSGAGFDDVADGATDALTRLSAGLDGVDAQLFLVGLSPSRRRFVAFSYDSQDGFRRSAVKGVFVSPVPIGVRPHPLVLRNLKEGLRRSSDDDAEVEGILAAWHRHRPLSPGLTTDQWIAVAKAVRRTRALVPPECGFKVAIGGDVVEARLTLDGPPSVETIHSFDDTGAEFAQMVAGTLHPDGQRGPCPCGSGTAMIDCHLKDDNDPCPCGSGRRFPHCCSVAATSGASS